MALSSVLRDGTDIDSMSPEELLAYSPTPRITPVPYYPLPLHMLIWLIRVCLLLWPLCPV
jgi:hypothetical protein